MKLVAELVVGFLGVYGAFWIDGHRDREERREHSVQILNAIQQDLEDSIEVSRGFMEGVVTGLNRWSHVMRPGEHPAPFVFRISGAESPPVTTWQVIQQAELSELLDEKISCTSWASSATSSRVSAPASRGTRHSRNRKRFPCLKDDSRRFCTADGTALDPCLEAHVDRLREIARFWHDPADWAACIDQRLESIPLSTPPCRTDLGVTPLR